MFFIKYESKYSDSLKTISGIITDIEKSNKKVIFTIAAKERIIAKYYLIDDLEFNYNLGDKLLLEVEENQLTNNTVPNSFNYKKYLANKKVFHVVTVTKITLISKNTNLIYTIKNYLLQKTNNLKSNHYIQALIFGQKGYIDEEINDSYRANGISHLFAISGLHINIFTFLIFLILKILKVKENTRYIIVIFFLLFYMFLTNYSMSIVRSGLFTCLCLVDKIGYFYIKKTNLLLLTLVIIIAINPLLVLDIGFLYSFSISFSLLLFQDKITKLKLNYLESLFLISLLAFLVSIPITINNFYQLNFLSIIYNMFFVPFISFIILPLLLSTYFIPILDNFLFSLLQLLETISVFLSKIDTFTFIFCKMNIFIIILYYTVIFLVIYKLLTKRIKYLLLLVILLIGHYFYPDIVNKQFLLMIDVNQGDSLLLHMNNYNILIDTGGYQNYYNEPYRYFISKNRIIPLLKSYGIKKIDILIITHGDMDHMGEATYLVNNFRIEKVIFNNNSYNEAEQDLIKILEEKRINYYRKITELNINNNKLYFLNTGIYTNENESSNVIYFVHYGYKFLFMGDAGLKRERDVLYKYDLTAIDFLKIGHHGSNTSSGKNFINSIEPKNCLISVGKNNKYGHPKQSVLDTLNNCRIYRTDINGSIEIDLDKDNYIIKTYNP